MLAGRRRSPGLLRLEMLESAAPPAEIESAGMPETPQPLEWLSDRLGRAGAFERIERRTVVLTLALITAAGGLGGIVLSQLAGFRPASALFAAFAGLNFGGCAAAMYLQRRERSQERSTLFFLPLMMEQLILLIEAGLGLLPALHMIVSAAEKKGQKAAVNPVIRALNLVYRLSSSGLPFASAVEQVAAAVPSRPLRHVLLHLDIGAAEGGELIPALRGLSDHCHQEWKHSVEGRIKKLENAVIFPVFGAVLGLMVLVAAVPLVPLIELREKLNPGSAMAQAGALDKTVPLNTIGGGK